MKINYDTPASIAANLAGLLKDKPGVVSVTVLRDWLPEHTLELYTGEKGNEETARGFHITVEAIE